MWSVSGSAAAVAIARSGCTSTGTPFSRRKPAGVFIQALAMHDEDARDRAADGDDDAGAQVGPWADAFPAVEVDAEEDGFGEEREPFEGERHPDDRAGVLHEAWPEETQLERQDRSRDGADGEENRGALRPPLGQLEVVRVARAQPAGLGDDHEGGHADADDRENDVKGQRHAHLRTCRQQIAHRRSLDRRSLTAGRSPDVTHRRSAVLRPSR